jgi:preprotein translocase subunit YajC
MLSFAILFLQAGDPQARPPGGEITQLLPLLIGMMVLGYFLMIRPMQKEKRELQAMLAGLKKNDEVVTTGGIIGTVVSVKEKEEDVLLKVDPGNNTRIRVLKSHIVRVKKEPEAEKEAPKEGGA